MAARGKMGKRRAAKDRVRSAATSNAIAQTIDKQDQLFNKIDKADQ